MASIVLTTVGSSIGGPPGAIAGGIAGSLIDSYLLMPLLFPQDPIRGSRIDDLQATVASEGSAQRWILGPRVRVGGTVIWQSDWRELKKTRRVGKGGGGQRVEEYEYEVDFAVAWNETTGLAGNASILKILGDGKVLYDSFEGDSGYYNEAVHYDGSQTTPDPYLEAVDGVGSHPAYMDIAYTVFKGFKGNEFGARIPKLEAIIVQDQDVSVQEALELVMERAGYVDTELSVARVRGCILGYMVSGPQAMTEVLTPILVAYGITVQEVAGGITFISRGFEDVIDVEDGALGAHASDERRPIPIIEFKDVGDRTLPSEVEVRYYDADADLQRGQETQHRWDHPGENTITVDLPLSLRSEDALSTAKRFLWSAEAERQAVDFSLPPSYLHVREGDVLRVTLDGVEQTFMARTVRRGADYRIAVQATTYEQDVYEQESVLEDSDALTSEIYVPPETTFYVVDAPALTNDAVESIGVLAVVAATDPEALWAGASIQSAADDTNFAEIQSLPLEGSIGTTVNALDSGPVHFFDMANSVIVRLINGSLQTVTEALCVAGQNRAAIRTATGEWEIFGFCNAELVAESTYKLSKLLRGRRGTEHLIDQHAPNQPFVFGDVALEFIDLGASKLGSYDYYRAPAVQGLISEYESQRVRVSGLTHRPFSPCHVRGYWNASNDFILSWTRRSRYLLPPYAAQPLAPDETPEAYEIDFWLGRGLVTLLRTVSVSEATTYTYTSTQQATDGLTPGTTPIHATIHQISTVYGRGIAADVLIYP